MSTWRMVESVWGHTTVKDSVRGFYSSIPCSGYWQWLPNQHQVMTKPNIDCHLLSPEILLLVGGFNPSEKYESTWESSPNRGENKKYFKPPPRLLRQSWTPKTSKGLLKSSRKLSIIICYCHLFSALVVLHAQKSPGSSLSKSQCYPVIFEDSRVPSSSSWNQIPGSLKT